MERTRLLFRLSFIFSGLILLAVGYLALRVIGYLHWP